LDAADGPIAVSARALFVVVGFEHFSTHGDPQALEKLAAQHEKNQRQRGDWEINP
ncbi:MAG TPA: PaaI family thioesterase, partial [Amycolatopsis sp.]